MKNQLSVISNPEAVHDAYCEEVRSQMLNSFIRLENLDPVLGEKLFAVLGLENDLLQKAAAENNVRLAAGPDVLAKNANFLPSHIRGLFMDGGVQMIWEELMLHKIKGATEAFAGLKFSEVAKAYPFEQNQILIILLFAQKKILKSKNPPLEKEKIGKLLSDALLHSEISPLLLVDKFEELIMFVDCRAAYEALSKSFKEDLRTGLKFSQNIKNEPVHEFDIEAANRKIRSEIEETMNGVDPAIIEKVISDKKIPEDAEIRFAETPEELLRDAIRYIRMGQHLHDAKKLMDIVYPA